MTKTYVNKSKDSLVKYEGSDTEMIEHLKILWKSNSTFHSEKVNFQNLPENINLQNFKNILKNISDNLVFRGNFGGYQESLEKELSLTKKSVMLNPKNCKLLYLCLDDLMKYDRIRPDLFKNIKFADIFVKHKKGDVKDPSNFRFLSNHSKIFKIIDKFWTNRLINVLTKNNSLPDKSIVRNSFDRKYATSIRDLAYEKLVRFHTGKKIVLLDVKKAFDSVTWNVLYEKLVNNLSRKVNNQFAKKIMNQYMFLNTKRCILFKDHVISFSRSIATGLPSSTIIYSLLIEELIYEWKNKNNTSNLIVNTFVDDMYLEFEEENESKDLVESLIRFLGDNNLIINESKTKTNIESLPYSKITKSDCYLGLPFAKTKKDYIIECIKMFNERMKFVDYINANEIIKILDSDDYEDEKKKINGFFNYKFYGLKNPDESSIDIINILKSFIKKID